MASSSPSPCSSPSLFAHLADAHAVSPASPASPSPSGATPWHFPFGPSSRFTQRERTRPAHTRHKSNYTPRAPVLSTEKRARHRRAASYGGKSLFGVSTSTTASASPLGRFPSLRADTSSRMAASTSSNGPVTPSRAKAHRRGSSLLQDSPFSDYFTDDARSLESQFTPTSETQRLLVRLNKLQSQLMRGENTVEVLNIVGRRMSEIEGEVEGLHSQTRYPIEMEEDIFTQEEREYVLSSRPSSKRQHSNPLGIQEVPEEEEEEEEEADGEVDDDAEWEQERQENLLHEAQAALQSLTEAQEQLRQRHREIVNLNEEYALDMEEKEMEVERLRSENESLKSDLGFDHSELLFLELQLKSLEVECENVSYDPKLERLQRQMENWRDDWRDVEARFKKRRARYGVTSQDDKATPNGVEQPEQEEDDPQDWRVEVKKQGSKRVNSLTIRRVSREAEDEERRLQLEQATPTKLPTSDRDPTPKPEGTRVPDRPTSSYTSQATQTSPPPSPTLTPVSLSEALGLEGPFNPSIDDCAITTSPSSHADDDSEVDDEDDDEDEEVEDEDEVEGEATKSAPLPFNKKAARSEQKRTALRELWSGLTNWAGMDDEDDW